MRTFHAGFDRRIKVSALWSLTNLRLDDGWALFKTGHPERRNGAIYIGGYSVECALKAKICERRKKSEFNPDSDLGLRIHRLMLLAERGGLLDEIKKSDVMMTRLVGLDTVWSVALRYQQRSIKPREVERFLENAEGFKTWLRAL